MKLPDGLAALLAGLLLLSAADGSGIPGAVLPSGGTGQYGARLSPRSYNVHNSYPAVPYGGHHGGVVDDYTNAANSYNIDSSYTNAGSSYTNAGSSYNNAGSSYNNAGSSYNNAGSSYNNVGSNYNTAGSSYNNVGSNYNNAGSNYNNAGNNYSKVGNNYDGVHSVYIRNNGLVADNGYSVETASSTLHAQSVHAVGPTDHDDYQDNYLGDSGNYDDDSRFQYRYEVSDPRTGDAKSQHETRHGDAVTGEYRVLEANGLMRIVSYTADDAHGFVARVRWVPAERPHGPAVSHQEVTQQQSH